MRVVNWDGSNKYIPLVIYSLPITEKRCDAKISVVLSENSVNTSEKSGLLTEYRRCAGISLDPEITDVKPA